MKNLVSFDFFEGAMANQKSLDQLKKASKGTSTSTGSKDLARGGVQSKEAHQKTAKPAC